MIIQIENTNICNARCCFCPHKIMRRPKGIMAQSDFENIISDCANYPIDGVAITGIGETLLDPGIIDKVAISKKKLGVDVTIYTNGTNLKKYLKDLLKAGLSSLVVSLNAINGEKRKAIMGIDLYDELHEIITNWDYSKCRLTVCAIPDMGIMERYDCDGFIEKYGQSITYFHYASNWGGKYNFDLKFKPVNSCPRPFEIFHVNWDGNFVLCCLDYEGKVVLGRTINEVINSEKWNYYRKMLHGGERSQLELCGNCSTV